MPSTSKASETPAKGRKRVAPKAAEAEIPDKIAKPTPEATSTKTPPAKAKAGVKAKPVKNGKLKRNKFKLLSLILIVFSATSPDTSR